MDYLNYLQKANTDLNPTNPTNPKANIPTFKVSITFAQRKSKTWLEKLPHKCEQCIGDPINDNEFDPYSTPADK